MKDKHGDKRRFQRVSFHATTVLCVGATRHEVTLVDLSLNGLLVEVNSDIDLQSAQTIQAEIKLEGDALISMDVSLSHKQGTQFGLKCEMIDVDSISHLRRLIELNTGDAQAAERELSELAAEP